MTEIIGVVAIASIAIRMRNALSRKRTVRKRTILLLMVSMVKTFFFVVQRTTADWNNQSCFCNSKSERKSIEGEI